MRSETDASPLAYLESVLDYIRDNSVMRNKVEWTTLRQDAMALARNARTTADTYPAIRLALRRLGDHHSYFVEPEKMKQAQQGRSLGLGYIAAENTIAEVFINSPAEGAGLRLGDVIVARSSGDDGVHLTLQRATQVEPIQVTLKPAEFDSIQYPRGRRLENELGYIELPGLGGNSEILQHYANAAQQIICAIDRIVTRGWVVDLRRNTGGNMWPMLAGIGAILGEGEIGAFIRPSGERMIWAYRNGKSWIDEFETAAVNEPIYQLKKPWPPIAVLTSSLTCSSGEAVTIAFRARPHTRSFGEPTRGIPTANNDIRLSDGAWLMLTEALEADRTGQTYADKIPPDQPVTIDWSMFDTDADPVLRAAVEWLHDQP